MDMLLESGAVALAAAAVVLLLSALVTVWGRRRLDKDLEFSSTAVAFFAMVFALALEFALYRLLPLLPFGMLVGASVG